MKLIKIVNAYIALGVLSKEKMRFKDSLNVKLLRNKMSYIYNIFADEEKTIVERVCAKDAEGNAILHKNGYFEFKSPEAKEDYIKSIKEISEYKVDLKKEGIEPITISPPNTITAELLEALEDFVMFEEDTNEGAS